MLVSDKLKKMGGGKQLINMGDFKKSWTVVTR